MNVAKKKKRSTRRRAAPKRRRSYRAARRGGGGRTGKRLSLTWIVIGVGGVGALSSALGAKMGPFQSKVMEFAAMLGITTGMGLVGTIIAIDAVCALSPTIARKWNNFLAPFGLKR